VSRVRSEVGGQVGVVRVVELDGHLRNGDGRILPEPLCRLLEPVASDHCEWKQANEAYSQHPSKTL